jgi:hypothetical protein
MKPQIEPPCHCIGGGSFCVWSSGKSVSPTLPSPIAAAALSGVTRCANACAICKQTSRQGEGEKPETVIRSPNLAISVQRNIFNFGASDGVRGFLFPREPRRRSVVVSRDPATLKVHISIASYRAKERTTKVKEPRFVLVAAVAGSILLHQSSLAQTSFSVDRINGGQAIQIKREPNMARLAAKPAETKGAVGTRRSRHRAFLVPRKR